MYPLTSSKISFCPFERHTSVILLWTPPSNIPNRWIVTPEETEFLFCDPSSLSRSPGEVALIGTTSGPPLPLLIQDPTAKVSRGLALRWSISARRKTSDQSVTFIEELTHKQTKHSCRISVICVPWKRGSVGRHFVLWSYSYSYPPR